MAFPHGAASILWGTRDRHGPITRGLAWHRALHAGQRHAGHPPPNSEGDKEIPCESQGSKMD